MGRCGSTVIGFTLLEVVVFLVQELLELPLQPVVKTFLAQRQHGERAALEIAWQGDSP